MMINDAHPDRLDSVVHEHLELRQLVDHIQCVLTKRRNDGTTLRILLDALENRLATHFAREEGEDGDFPDVARFAPRFIDEIDALRAQHSVLQAMIDGLVRKASHAMLTSYRWQDIADDFEQFAEHFIEHEVDQSNLLQRAYCEDFEAED